MNYTLELDANGPFSLHSDDATLSLSADGELVFSADGWPYPLRSVAETDGFDPAEPGRIWANGTESSHHVVIVPQQAQITIATNQFEGSRVWIDGHFVGRFEVFVYGGKNQVYSWSEMAFVAPLDYVRGSGLQHMTLHE
jgi:hexosaminidase